MGVTTYNTPSKEFLDAALPLATHLATLSIRSPVHTTLVADLYDIVNDIRDALVVGAREEITEIKSNETYMFDEKKKHRVAVLQGIIRQSLGGE